MGILDKIINPMMSNESSFIKNSWQITRIGSTEKFIEFVLLQAPEGCVWALGDDTALETLDNLSENGLSQDEIKISEDIRKKLIALLPALKISENIVSHSIQLPDGNLFLKSYDNLTCVWLSKLIPENIMISAIAKYDFNYKDSNDCKTTKT